MRITNRRIIYFSLGLLLLLVGVRVWCIFGPPGDRVEFLVAKDTTYITEPLRADGRPDYVQAINDKLSEGVTPENNAAVLFYQAVGPKDVPPSIRERFFKTLGMPVPPEKGAYFVPWDTKLEETFQDDPGVANDQDVLDHLEEQLYSHPWSAELYPSVAEWLASNTEPLKLLEQASRRSHYYVPFLAEKTNTSLLGLFDNDPVRMRNVTKAFLIRAMFHLENGHPDKTWDDILIARRLSRFVGRGRTLIRSLVEMTIDGTCAPATMNLLHDPRCDVRLIKRIRADLAAFPRSTPVVDDLTFGERFMLLDCAMLAADNDLQILKNGRPGSELQRRLFNAGVDWNEALRVVNSWCERFVAVHSMPDGPKKQQAATSLSQSIDGLKGLRGHLSEQMFTAAIPVGSWRVSNGQKLGVTMVELFAPGYRGVFAAEDRTKIKLQLLDVACDLALYRAENGQYPEKLAALVPKFLPSLPTDPFSTGTFLYRRTDDGYVIYSVGPNGQDDRGEELGSEIVPAADDIALWAGMKPVPKAAEPATKPLSPLSPVVHDRRVHRVDAAAKRGRNRFSAGQCFANTTARTRTGNLGIMSPSL